MRNITIIAMLAFAPAIGAQDFSPYLDPQARAETAMIWAALARLQTDEGRVALRSSAITPKSLSLLVKYAKQTQDELERLATQMQGRICTKKEEYRHDPLRLAAVLDEESEAFEVIRYRSARRALAQVHPVDAAMFRLMYRNINVPPHPGSYGHLIRIGDLNAERFLTVYCSQ